MTGLEHKGSAESISQFWERWDSAKKDLGTKDTNVRVFKQEITPIWEDPANAKGGKFVSTIRDFGVAIKAWVGVLTSLIAGELSRMADVCGAVFSVRNDGAVISLWNRDASSRESISTLSGLFSRLVGVPTRYQSHMGGISKAMKPETELDSDLPTDDFLSALSQVKIELENRSKKTGVFSNANEELLPCPPTQVSCASKDDSLKTRALEDFSGLRELRTCSPSIVFKGLALSLFVSAAGLFACLA
eukprot:TRINITY_DN99_c0_g1_i1.p1 TRINITY_DN99_c0_g1~~TRINITY_DN99_c0_g1_i1.p1  ORF type:complete len:246 (-),score=4.33 TRINITY_DN99_c0_g1_i1:80-817(-)